MHRVFEHETSAQHPPAGTKCLYMIAAATGEVSIVSTSTVPLLPFVLVSTHCVLTVTVFGSVQCHSRSASVTEVLWLTDFGFAPPMAGSIVPPIVVGSGLLLVTLGERVIALDDATGVIAWEHRASSTVSISVVNNNLVAASCAEVVSIPLDPVSNPSGSPAWRANTSGFLSAASAAPCTKVLAPALTAAGTIVATFGNVLGAWNAVDGSFAYVQYANGGVCNRLYVPPFTSGAATPQNNVFIASCGQTEVRSVATGAVIAYIGERENSAYCPSPIAIIPSTGKVVFCSSDGMTIESIPSFIASLAPPVVQVPTAPPMSFTIAPGATPFGVPTPAPTYPDLPDDRIPDASCVWAMQDLYPSLAACVVDGLTAAFNASLLSEQNGMMNCSSTARSLSPCISSWLTQAASPPFCPGALVYLNTILQSLNHTGALGVCHQATQCVDGAAGSALLCSLVNSATAGADGLVFSSVFVSRLPPPINALPSFQAQTPPPPNHVASPGSTMSSGAVAGIVVGVLCALLIILAVFRKRAKTRELEARLDEANNNHDGPIVVSSRSGSELGSVHGGSKGRLLEVNQEAYASIN